MALTGAGESSGTISGASLWAIFLWCILGISFAVVLWKQAAARRWQSGWTRILHRATAQIAEGKQRPQIVLGSDTEFNKLAIALNRIGEITGASGGRIAELERVQQRLSTVQSTLGTAAKEISLVTSRKDLPNVIVQTLNENFRGKRVQLWLLHSFTRNGADPSPRPAPPPHPRENMTPEMVLERVGLYEAACIRGFDDSESKKKNGMIAKRGAMEAAMTQRTIACESIAASPLFAPSGAVVAEWGLKSYLALPLVFQDRTIGVVELFSDSPYDEFERGALEIFASLVCLSLTSSWSIQESTQNREALEFKNIELERANRKLERTNQRLTQADKLKGEFLANTSHELRTPLNSILGFARLLMSGACKTEEEREKYAKAIYESGERLLTLINDVLDLAKIEAGKLSVKLGPVELLTQLDAIRTLMEIQAGQQNNRLTFEVPEVPLPSLRADAARLHQVLVNLIGNAIKFTKDGMITVRVKPNNVPGFMRIEIQDSGIGISPEVQRQLFQSFVQGDGSSTRKFGGTGLGLVISKKIVELLGGAIELRSLGEGHGTTVSIDLPLWSEELESEPAEVGGSENAEKNRTAVVIEDYLEYQKYLKELLEDRGFVVKTARTAAKGLELIQKNPPSVVILDVHLPCDSDEDSVQSGYDVIRALGQRTDMTSVPIFVVTGMRQEATDALLSQTILLPVELYSKPLDEKLFLNSLDRLAPAA